MKRLLRNLPFKYKLMAVTMAISSAALLLACAVFAFYEQGEFRRAMARDFAILADTIGENVASGLAFNDPPSIAQTLQTLRAHPGIVAACAYDKQGAVVATFRRAGYGSDRFTFPAVQPTGQRFGPDRLDTFKDITLSGEVIGVMYIGADLSGLRERAWRYAMIVGFLLAGSLLVALGLASWLQRFIAGPIEDLAQTVATIAAGKNYAVRARKEGDDELGRLVDGFNEMLVQVQARDTALQAAHGQLEARVEERTRELSAEIAERQRTQGELAKSLSVLHATLESTVDGILVVDLAGRLTTFNRKFTEMWCIPREILDGGDDARALGVAVDQLREPGTFMHKVRELYAQPEAESFDVLELKDGRTFERYSQPQRVGAAIVGRVWGFRDITERKQAEDQLRSKTAFLEAQLHSSIDGILVVTQDGKKPVQNQRVADLFKIPPDIANGTDDKAQIRWVTDMTRNPREFVDKVQHLYAHPEEVSRDELELKDGTVLDRYSAPVVGQDGKYYGRIWTFRDITERKRTDESLRLLSSAVEQTKESIVITDAELNLPGPRIIFVNRAFTKMTGFAAPEAMGLTPRILQGPRTDRAVLDRLRHNLEQGEEFTGEAINYRKDGTAYDQEWQIAPLRLAGGAITHFVAIMRDITERKRAESELELAHKDRVVLSRQAGMAEVATGVLHNVGNVLNSVNVSATVVAGHVRHAKAAGIVKLAALFDEHKSDLADFLTRDPRGQMIPAYLATLAEAFAREQQMLLGELDELCKNIDHIKDIVAMQQSYARTSGVIEIVALTELVEDALRIKASALSRHNVETVRDYQDRPLVNTDRHKVMQVLINLLRNAKYACDEGSRTPKQITVRITSDAGSARIAISDNGVGIPRENLTRIFSHGFTTRKDGHGFGLHSGALAAKELGGALSVVSDGPGHGATFTLELPMQSSTQAPWPSPSPAAFSLPPESEGARPEAGP